MRDANVVTLYKYKGDRRDYNNYRGITLLSVVWKVFARVALTRLHILTERTLSGSQGGLITGRSTLDILFSVRQLHDKLSRTKKATVYCFV